MITKRPESSSTSSTNEKKNRRSHRISNPLPFYQRALALIDRLSLIRGYRSNFFDTIHVIPHSQRRSANLGGGSGGGKGYGYGHGIVTIGTIASQSTSDPIQLLWNSFRQGAGLCYLVNLLRPKIIRDINPPPEFKPLSTSSSTSSLSSSQGSFDFYRNNLCKKNVYQFLRACKEDLGMPGDRLFNVSEVYEDDTNGLVKVIRCVEWILDRLEEANILPKDTSQVTSRENSWLLQGSPSKSSPSASNSLRDFSKEYDHRMKIIIELLLTERKYVTDLEVMQDYVREADNSNHHNISKDLINSIFSNLNQVVDFQRKFLIDLEECLEADINDQLVGATFIKHEDGFSCYQAYCANHKQASSLILEKKDDLSKISRLDAMIELPSYLIKPIQRICKYPLILAELVKATPATHPDHSDLQEALIKLKKMAELLNEHNRRADNIRIVAELKTQVEDWKNHDIEKFGDLLLEDRLIVSSQDVEKELHVFLFERILVMFKETTTQSLIRRRSSKVLQLRGNIYLKEVTNIATQHKENWFILKIFWTSQQPDGLKSFMLKFRNEEKLAKWSNSIAELLPRLSRQYGSTSTINYEVDEKSGEEQEPVKSLSGGPVSNQFMRKSAASNASSFIGADGRAKSLESLHEELDRVINEAQYTTPSNQAQAAESKETSVSAPFASSSSSAAAAANIRKRVLPGLPPNLPLPPVPSADARNMLRRVGSDFKTPASITSTSKRETDKVAGSNENGDMMQVVVDPSELSFQDKRQNFKAKPPPSSLSSPLGKRQLSHGVSQENMEMKKSHVVAGEPPEIPIPEPVVHLQSLDDAFDDLLKEANIPEPVSFVTNSFAVAISNPNQNPNDPFHPNPNPNQSPTSHISKTLNEMIIDNNMTVTNTNSNTNANTNANTNTVTKDISPSVSSKTVSLVRSKKFKIHVKDEIFLLTVSFPISFGDLYHKIGERLESMLRMEGSKDFKIRYKDEDGDFVSVNSDQDLLEWMRGEDFEASSNNTLHFYITIVK